MNNNALTLDLDKRDVTDVVTLAADDRRSANVTVRINDHGVRLAQSGLTARLVVRMPGDASTTVTGTWSPSSGTATFQLNEADVEGVGRGTACVTLSDSTHTYSTSRFGVTVMRGE